MDRREIRRELDDNRPPSGKLDHHQILVGDRPPVRGGRGATTALGSVAPGTGVGCQAGGWAEAAVARRRAAKARRRMEYPLFIRTIVAASRPGIKPVRHGPDA